MTLCRTGMSLASKVSIKHFICTLLHVIVLVRTMGQRPPCCQMGINK